MEKKNSNIIIMLVLVMLFLSIGVSGFIISKNTKPTTPDEKTPTVPDNPDNPDNPIEPETLPTDPLAYVGNYGYQKGSGDNVEVDFLYLRNDGSFSFSFGNKNEYHVGNYSINDGKLILDTKVRYGDNSCFYKNNLQTFTLDIIRKDSFLFVNGNETKQFDIGIVGEEGKNGRNYHSINPIDGQIAEGVWAPWKDCTSN